MSQRNNYNLYPIQTPLTMSLTEDQRFLINHYINLYNSTLRQADVLYDNLEHIRRVLDYLSVSGMNNERGSTDIRRSRRRPESPLFSRDDMMYTPLRSEGTRGRDREGTRDREGAPAYQTTLDDWPNLLSRFQTPVIVAPSREQIENAVQQTTFGEIEVPRNVLCPISLEPFFPEHPVSVIRHCGHIFVPGQLASWLTTNVRCPVCRYDIREYPVQPTQEPRQEPAPISSVYNFITTMEYDDGQVIFDVSSSAISDTMTSLSTLLLQDMLRQGIQRQGTSLFTDVSFSLPPRR
jgi:hypothetical protein